jgi:hypothetical protein
MSTQTAAIHSESWQVLVQVAAILMSKLVLEPESHFGIARSGAIPILVQSHAQSWSFALLTKRGSIATSALSRM